MKWLPKFRFSMRTLFILVTLVCLALIWFRMIRHRAEQQKIAVTWVLGTGGRVSYDYQRQHEVYAIFSRDEPTDKLWLRSKLGNDFFDTVEQVKWNGKAVHDLSHLIQLPGLKIIDLFDTDVESLEPLSQLRNLEAITIYGGSITDISPLAKLMKLKVVDLRGSNVTDVSHLSNIPALRRVYWDDSQIASASTLPNLDNIEAVEVELHFQENLLYVTKFNCPVCLTLYTQMMDDLSPLEEIPHLISLYLEGDNISDISFLANQNNLNSLELNASSVTDFSPLLKLEQLDHLQFHSNTLTNLEIIAKLKTLESMSLTTPKVTDLSPLHNLANLEYLSLINMKVPQEEILKLQKKFPACQIKEYQFSNRFYPLNTPN
ncbi:MAG: hypothetical protein COA78_07640 [Blastopirellula sp.]|nr:MAG: hypothetical protein COA78_07640 [Blastopirellula sp.]